AGAPPAGRNFPSQEPPRSTTGGAHRACAGVLPKDHPGDALESSEADHCGGEAQPGAPAHRIRSQPAVLPGQGTYTGRRRSHRLGISSRSKDSECNRKRPLKQLWYLLRFPFELSPAHASSTGLPAVLSLGLFGLLLMVFAASPVTTSSDSKWSLYTAMSFAQGHGGD